MQPQRTLKQVIREQVQRFTWMDEDQQGELVESLYKDMTAPTPEPTQPPAQEDLNA